MDDEPVVDPADVTWGSPVEFRTMGWGIDQGLIEAGTLDAVKVSWATVRWTAEGFFVIEDGEDPG